MFLGHTYDGMTYQLSQNTSYSTYQIPNGCPYVGPFQLDIRCRYYYQPTISSISTVIFPPSVQFGGGLSYTANVFCQRRLKYEQDNPDSKSSPYSVFCITLDLSVIPKYFQNFGRNSKFQLLFNPYSQTMVFDSTNPLQTDAIVSVQQTETNYLQDQTQASLFLNNISQSSLLTNLSLNSINLEVTNTFSTDQYTFNYIRNGTNCFVVINTITLIDKFPSFEYLKSINASQKYELQKVFLFLDVLSEENMQKYSQNVQTTIKYYNKIFTYISWGVIVLVIGFQLYNAILLGRQIMQPVIHLTRILREIRISNQNSSSSAYAPSSFNKSTQDYYQSNFSVSNNQAQTMAAVAEVSIDLNNQIQIDEQLDLNLEGICFSSDTQILLDSFQNVFNVLRFTTQNYYQENESLSLLNLNMQIQHFKQFGNCRALGVCHNNMGVIHYNGGRFLEAIESFQQAVIYANYELNIYSHDGEGSAFIEEINRYAACLRNSIFTSQDTPIHSNAYSQSTSDQIFLYWSLYNRNQNYLKAVSQYFNSEKYNLWDLFLDKVLENISISQQYLPPSNKREMLNYYTILHSIQNSTEDQNTILQKFILLYLKKNAAKQQHQSSNKQSSYQTGLQTIQTSLQGSSSLIGKTGKEVQNSVLLLSPVKKQQKQQPKFKSNKSKYYQDSIQDSIFINKPLNNSVKNLFEGIKNESNKQQKEIMYHQPIPTPNVKKESLYSSNINIGGQIVQKSPTPLMESEIRQKKLTYDNHQSPETQSQIIKADESKFLKRISNFFRRIHHNLNQRRKTSQKGNPMINSSTPNELNSAVDFQTSSSNKMLGAFSRLRQNSRNKKHMKEKKRSDSYDPQNSKTDKFSKTFQSSRQEVKKQVLFFNVRKIANVQKVSQYEFSSDIYFAYYALQQARLQIKLKNYLIAAEILTNALEQCKFYLPYLKRQILKALKSIFCIKQIEDRELEVMIQKYQNFSSCNQHVCLISACNSSQNKKRVLAITNDLVNEILFKDTDSFGMLSYQFEEHTYCQIMGFTLMKTIRSNKVLFQSIFHSIQSKIKNSKHKNNGVEKSTYKETNLENNYLNQVDLSNQHASVPFKDQSFNFNSRIESENQLILKNNKLYQHLQFNSKRQDNLKNIPKVLHQSSYERNKDSGLSQSEYIKIVMQKQDEENENSSSSFNSSQEEEVLYSNVNQIKPDQKNDLKHSCYPPCQIACKEQPKNVINPQKQNSKNNKTTFIQDNQFDETFESFNQFNTSNKQPNLDLIAHHNQAFDQSPSQNKYNFNKIDLNSQSCSRKEELEEKYNTLKKIDNNHLINKDQSLTQHSPCLSKNHSLELNNPFLAKNQFKFERKNTGNYKAEERIDQEHRQINIKNIKTSEEVFHFGIQAALKQFLLNTDNKITTYVSKRRLKNYDRIEQKQAEDIFQNTQTNQTYLIYCTDQPLYFSNNELLQRLSELLQNLKVELLILMMNEKQQLDEFSHIENIINNGKSIISFFNTEEKLLQYIYNYREHLKNYLIPMIVEHF